MHPVISIGVYAFSLIITIGLTVSDVRRAFGKNGFSTFLNVILVAALLAFGVTPILGALLKDSYIKFFLQALGNLFLGFYIYYLGLLLLLRLALIICRIASGKEGSVRYGIAFFVSLIGAAVIFVYGLFHAQQIYVTSYDVDVEKSAGDLDGMKVVLLGDLHVSVNSHPETIEKMVELVNTEEPDVVLVAGDLFTSTYAGVKDPEKYAQILRGIQAKYGTYAVYGNHDVEETLLGGFPISPISEAFRSREMELFFSECGLTVLYDETREIAGGTIQIVGRVDGEKAGDGTALRKSASEVLEGTDLLKPVIVLQHEPVEFSALKEAGADLVLCGHTHDGQIFPGNLIVPFFNENAYGYKEINGLDTIVTSGVGYYGPPLRVGTNAEITVVNLHFTGK